MSSLATSGMRIHVDVDIKVCFYVHYLHIDAYRCKTEMQQPKPIEQLKVKEDKTSCKN